MIGSQPSRVAQVVALALAGIVLLASVAVADNLQADLDTSTGGLDKTVDRGTLSPSTGYTQSVFLFVDETSGTTNNPTYPFSVSLDGATLNGSPFAGASFSGVSISAAGTANGRSGNVGWTTPAAQATSQNYSLVASFLASTTINESPSTITITFTIAAAPSDTTPPDSTITSAPDSPTSSTSAAFTYTSTEAGSTFGCSLDGAAFTSCPAGGKSYSDLAGGSHTFAVRATDAAGNTDASPASHSWTIDLTAPDTTIVTAPPVLTNSADAAFTYTSSEAGSSFDCKIDDGSFESCPAAGKSYSGLAEGAHSFAVRATDAVGNADASPASYEWTIDLTPPAVSAPDLADASDTGLSQVDDVSKDATPTFTGTAEDGSLVELLRDGSVADSTTASGGIWSFTSASLAEGTYAFAARATDAAGNAATSSALDIVVDLTNPAITPASRLPAANGAGWNNGAVTVTWNCTDALSGATSATASDLKTEEGAGQIANGTCSDVAGNSASTSLGGINIDLTAPVASASATSDDADYVAGTWANEDVIVTFGCTDALAGVASLEPASATLSADGVDQSASTLCADAAGNTAGASFTDIDIDKTDPVVTASAVKSDTTPYAGGWTNQDIIVSFDCTDALSGVDDMSIPVTVGEGEDQEVSGSCTDNAGNSSGATFSDIDIDKTAPGIAFSSRVPTPNVFGWNNTAVTVTWSCTDALSGPLAATASDIVWDEGAGQSANGTCWDLAGNSAGASQAGIAIDLTDPYGIQWLGGPADGASYYFGSVPAAPTCSASDDLSLLDSCVVTGHATSVGSHTMTATATDRAGNDATATSSYSVLAWTLRGFYSPVDMNGVWNTVKNGSTVPLKWEMFAGSTELTDTSLVSLDARQVPCAGAGTEDAVELTATGGTSLRYDATGGQFIYNWQTPKKAGTCYRVTMAATDGSTLVALFKLK
ncbi:MAG: PxKF domain-containing protein [Actinomycetota bacterium]